MNLETRVASLEAALQQQRQSAARTVRLWRGAAISTALLGLLLNGSLRPTHAEGNNSQAGGLPALEKRVAGLEARVANLQATNAEQAQQIAGPQSQAAALQAASAQNAARTGVLEGKLFHFSRLGNEVFITGANLNVVNGLGATSGNPEGGAGVVNGLGNLIVGYNEQQDEFFHRDRSGSHNIVVGRNHGYSSWGGLISGYNNELRGPYTSITGGVLNTTDGFAAAVGGGRGNRATGNYSSVGGGDSNGARGEASTVSGGFGRQAQSLYDWVAGSLFQDQ